MNQIKQLTLILCLVVPSLTVHAQGSMKVGELLDKGAKKASKEELMKLLPGTTVGGVVPRFPNRAASMAYKADGTASGDSWDVIGGGRGLGVFGTWKVNESGSLCIDFQAGRGRNISCQPWYPSGISIMFRNRKIENQWHTNERLKR